MTLPVVPRRSAVLVLATLGVLLPGATAASASTELDDYLQPGYCAKVTVQAGTPSGTVVTVCRP